MTDESVEPSRRPGGEYDNGYFQPVSLRGARAVVGKSPGAPFRVLALVDTTDTRLIDVFRLRPENLVPDHDVTCS